MKKRGYCENCNYEFDYSINNMDDLKNVSCSKCGKIIDTNARKVKEVTKLEKSIGNVARGLFNFYFYFYLIFSVLGIVFFYLGFDKLFLICVYFMLGLYIIELLLGFTRNIFGFFGIILGGILGYLLLNNVFLGINYVFLLSSIIKVIYNFIINFLIRRFW